MLELVSGAKELAKGNFDHRLKQSKYQEINTLTETYNQMAENLQSLYQNLENKVKERTIELKMPTLN